MSESIDRREFMKLAGTAGVGLGVAGSIGSMAAAGPTTPRRHGQSANDKVTMAVIGTNSRGLALAEMLVGLPNVEVSYVCDVDDRAIAKGIDVVRKRQKNDPKGRKDFRRALEDEALDGVAIASPDHWHAPMSILALSAGKHVFVEKPCSHNLREGELLVEAVRKHRRVLQMGAQRRSFPNMQQAIKAIHEGIIGRAYFGRAWYVNSRTSIGRGQPAPVPAWLDYELWQGPAPRRPYRDNLIHYNWHWFWHYGTGEALNNGTHEVDVCRWALGVDWPVRVTSNGGRYHFDDDWETPDTQVIAWDFPGGQTIAWESRSCNDYPLEGLGRGVLIFGTNGSALLDGNNYTIFDARRQVVRDVRSRDTQADRANTLSSTGLALDQLHVKNFIEAVRTGTPPSDPVEEGHKSVGILHLGNIAWRVRRELDCDPATGRPLNDAEAMKLWGREYEPGWAPVI
jgi:predicted dehydrogenase